MPIYAALAVASAFLIAFATGTAAAPEPVQGPEPGAAETETIVIEPGEAQPEAVEDDEPAPPARPSPAEVPIVRYDVASLPTPVGRLREQIMEAAATGEPEALRPIFEGQDLPPELGPADAADPVDYLVSLSGDAEGREILAIVIEVFEAGFVHVDVGTPDEMYVWPYFARYPVEALTPPQLVELFKLVYAGDYEDMLAYGVYTSFRAGISPDGTWRYFFTD
jgi:hypothetical protein